MTTPQPPVCEDRLLRVIDFAELLRVSKRTAFQIIHEGSIPIVRVGKRSPRIRIGDALAWIAERRT